MGNGNVKSQSLIGMEADSLRERQRFLELLEEFILHAGERTPDGYGRKGRLLLRGETTLMNGVAAYLQRPEVPTSCIGARWVYHLDHYLVDAFEAMRTEPGYAGLRDMYRRETGGEDVPDLLELHLGVGQFHRTMVVSSLISLCATISGLCNGDGERTPCEWLRAKLEATFNAQAHVVDGAWLGFVRKAYRELAPRIDAERHRTNVGVFGATTLRTFACAGRVLYNFSRDGSKYLNELCYVADESDMHGRRAGPNTTRTRYNKCVEMIEEVTALWSLDAMKPEAT